MRDVHRLLEALQKIHIELKDSTGGLTSYKYQETNAMHRTSRFYAACQDKRSISADPAQ